MKDSAVITNVTVISEECEVNIKNVSALKVDTKVGTLMLNVDQINQIVIMSGYKFSEDIEKAIDLLLLDSYEIDKDDHSGNYQILDQLRALYNVKNFLKILEKGKD